IPSPDAGLRKLIANNPLKIIALLIGSYAGSMLDPAADRREIDRARARQLVS
ncbi:MAG: hypothetical protein QOE85_839, partial [Actinomycetota bacterium]|nr:hypothetical protein [Actinomycetota bacterium]